MLEQNGRLVFPNFGLIQNFSEGRESNIFSELIHPVLIKLYSALKN